MHRTDDDIVSTFVNNLIHVGSLILQDVTPLTLGIEIQGHLMSVVVPRNTEIPCRKKEPYTTIEHGQTATQFSVFEGKVN